MTSVFVVLAWRRSSGTFDTWTLAPLLAALACVIVLDLEARIIPNVLTLPGLGYALLVSVVLGRPPIVEAVLGALVSGGLLLAVALVSRGGLGGGDVKLGTMVGAALGWKLTLIAVALSQVAGAVVALATMALRRRLTAPPIPVGALIALFSALLLIGR